MTSVCSSERTEEDKEYIDDASNDDRCSETRGHGSRPSRRPHPSPRPEPEAHPGGQDKCNREHHPAAQTLCPGGNADCGKAEQPEQADCGTNYRGSEDRFHGVSLNVEAHWPGTAASGVAIGTKLNRLLPVQCSAKLGHYSRRACA